MPTANRPSALRSTVIGFLPVDISAASEGWSGGPTAGADGGGLEHAYLPNPSEWGACVTSHGPLMEPWNPGRQGFRQHKFRRVRTVHRVFRRSGVCAEGSGGWSDFSSPRPRFAVLCRGRSVPRVGWAWMLVASGMTKRLDGTHPPRTPECAKEGACTRLASPHRRRPHHSAPRPDHIRPRDLRA